MRIWPLFAPASPVDFLREKTLNSGNMIIPITNLSVQQLLKAAALKEKIQKLEKELGRILGSPVEAVGPVARKKRRKMSAAGRAKIAAAQRARWAKVNGRKSATKPVKKAKRKMSLAARKKIAAAAKARWAKAKAAGKKTL